ncbi:MAG: alpha/beta hydrolase fold protein [Actinomycetia bacterium]|nr:alpha/beta hydrolase fold protein [Actinomycetes bacterium]
MTDTLPRMTVAHLNGIDVYYERRGEGPRLLFVNGSGATLQNVAPLVDVYAGRFDLLAHDQRGLGRTSIPPGPYSMADYAEDAAALAAHIGWESYRVVGMSFGGMVAQELAVTYPDRIERLALLCTSPGGDGGSSYPLDTLVGKPADEVAAIRTRIMDTRFTPEWLAEHEGDRMLIEMVTAEVEPRPADVLRGEALQLEARAGFDAFDRLPRISCPTLVTGGRYDGIAPLANSEAIAGQIPGAELRVYEGGHMFFVQDGRAFPDILTFLSK